MEQPDYLWGAATSAYQIEGATRADGRGESIWDRFAATPGHIADGSTGDPACDHYHRVREDVTLMRELGLQAYRFSIAWPRIQPDGRGAPLAAGLDFYDRLVELLLENNIRPFVTLYHWDLPQTLQDQGGWVNRDTVERFVEYADIVSSRLGDRVHDWITHNEPWVVAFLGHVTGEHAPGLKNPAIYTRVAHHLLLSHGLVVPVIRANMRHGDPRVGITLNLHPIQPATERDEDRRAAAMVDGMMNRLYLDPLFKAAYPDDLPGELLGAQPLEVERSELETIATPIDFLGVNYYTRQVVTMGDNGRPQPIRPGPDHNSTGEYTAMDWEVYPRGLYDLLMRLTRDYAPPALYITENGAAYDDTVGPDGAVHDPQRQAYLQSHTEEAQRAIADGAPLKGYFAWSLLDNWEWAFGYTKRFGIVYVDYTTQRRIVKDSGYWYQRMIAGE